MWNNVNAPALLGANGHGIRRPPSLATNLALMNGTEMAAPYIKHIAMAAPDIASTTPELLIGLLEPSVASPKPPAARNAPTTTMEFRASRTLKAKDCNGCGLINGTIIVTNLAVVPPKTYLCYPIRMCDDCEVLIPYDTVEYDKEVAKYFTLATNVAYAISLRTISRPVDGVLNGTATSAHVMDLDDICTYSAGSFDQAATTNCDSVTGVPLTDSTIGIMGPESYSSELQAPFHCGAKQYPGWSYSINSTKNAGGGSGNIGINFCDLTSHRFFPDTTFEISAIITLEEVPKGCDYLSLYLAVVKGRCPPNTESCDQDTLHKWAEANVDWILIGTQCTPPPKCPMPTSENEIARLLKEKKEARIAAKKAQKEKRKNLKCKKRKKCDDDDDMECPELSDDDEECPEPNSYTSTCCKNPKPKSLAKLPPGGETSTQISLNGLYTTCSLENAVGAIVDGGNCLKIKCVRFEIRTYSSGRVNQFGPAIVQRVDDVTKDIILQLNIKSVVAGIQTGLARTIAQPTPPSRLPLGTEDPVITQAIFDDASSGICRMYTGPKFAEAAAKSQHHTRATGIALMQAAPLGDTIRSIANTISGIGHAIGGPFGAIGNVIGGIGNAAGSVGDVISKIFSAPAPTRVLHAAPSVIHAAPASTSLSTIDWTKVSSRAVTIPKKPELDPITPEQVRAEARREMSYTDSIKSMLYSPDGPVVSNTVQAFPWVDPATQTGGIAHVFITTVPVTIPGRNVQYIEFTVGDDNYYVDQALVRSNEPSYVAEALLALKIARRPGAFLTTDATADVFGDSFAAAVLGAIVQPTSQAAVTGGLIYNNKSGTLQIKPVGLTPLKIQAAIDNNMTIIAPVEEQTTYLRLNTAGTEVVHISDILLGYLEQTPNVILVSTLSDLVAALTFIKANAATPIGEEEIKAKEEIVAPGVARQTELKALEEQFGTADKTPAQVQALKTRTFPIDIPGFEQQVVPLLDPGFYEAHRALIIDPPPAGMGIKPERLTQKIAVGDLKYLTSVATSVLSRTLSRARKEQGRRKRTSEPRGRQPEFKRKANPSQMAALIERLRNATNAAAAQAVAQPPPPPPPTTGV